jgi:hypothetical protein
MISRLDLHDFIDMPEQDYDKIVVNVGHVLSKFTGDAIQHVSLQSFMQNVIGYTDGDAFKFYGVPISKLSYYQIDVFAYASIFRDILQKNPPTDIAQNPEALLAWSDKRRAIEEKAQAMGASASDADGNEAQNDKLDRILAEGKTLRADETFRAFGGKLANDPK